MTTPGGSTATYAPLLAQRRRLRDRALAVLYDRHSGRAEEPRPGTARLDPRGAASPSARARLVGLARRALGGSRPSIARLPAPSSERTVAASSPIAEAALAQRLTGPGSGPYSGTPFRPPAVASLALEPTTRDGVGEYARHDHGIIDHSRHVSSIGRR